MKYLSIFDSFYRVLIVDERYKVLLRGLQNTLIIAILGLFIGIAVGILVAITKVTPKKTIIGKVGEKFAHLYTTIIRGTPVAAQLLLVYFGILSSFRNISALTIAIIVFGLNSGAYVSEIIRGGILAIDKGQTEAGRSLGLSYSKTMRKIILPQTVKIILPAMINEFIALLKETSVAGFITVVDLTAAAGLLVAASYDAFIPYLILSVTYLIMVIIITKFAQTFEMRLKVSD